MPDQPNVRVVIDTGPLTITVEAPVGLDVARDAALGLYREVWREDMRSSGSVSAGVGFVAERSEQ